MGEQPASSRVGLILAVAGVVVGAALGWLQRPGVPPAPPTHPAPAVTAETPLIEVHVAGWVVSPGVVAIPEGSLVADAIRAAGGLRPGARADGVNLAAQVSPGQQLVIPGPGGDEPGVIAPEAGPGGSVAVNRASASELESLPGVGPVLAGRIVAYREQHGSFREVEDLLAVPGIGEAKLAAIRDLITVP